MRYRGGCRFCICIHSWSRVSVLAKSRKEERGDGTKGCADIMSRTTSVPTLSGNGEPDPTVSGSRCGGVPVEAPRSYLINSGGKYRQRVYRPPSWKLSSSLRRVLDEEPTSVR